MSEARICDSCGEAMAPHRQQASLQLPNGRSVPVEVIVVSYNSFDDDIRKPLDVCEDCMLTMMRNVVAGYDAAEADARKAAQTAGQ